MTSVLHLHGFASSPQSRKVEALRAILERDGVELNVPDLNVPSFENLDFEAMVQRGVDAARRIPPRAIVGSSLGALVALEIVHRGILAPLVLIAPALGVADLWITELPPGDPVVVFNHATGKDAPIHRKFFEQVERITCDREPPPVRVTAIMGTDDESVPFDRVLAVWERWLASGKLVSGSLFVEIPGGDHSLLDHVDVIAREILATV